MISHITDKLYIGNANDARDTNKLDELGITAVFNVAHDLNDPYDTTRRYFKIGLTDGENNPIRHPIMAASLLHQLIKAGDTVLLHCHEGRSRSAFIATLYLSNHTISGGDNQKAYDLICEMRPLCKGMNSYFKELLKVE